MRTSEQIGTKPQARNARSDAAFPGATWAQHRSPGIERGQSGPDQAAAMALARRAGVEQLDGELPPAGESSTEHDEADVVAEDREVGPIAGRPTDPRMVVEIGAAGQRRARGALGDEHDVEAADPAAGARRAIATTGGLDAPP